MIYIFSKLTLKYYSFLNDVYTEIPVDDSKEEYNNMMLDFNAIDQVESLPFEIEEMNKPKVPVQVHNHKLRLALIHFETMPSSIDLAIDSMTDGMAKEQLFTLWNYAPMLERSDSNLIYMATQFGITSEQLDQIFIYANSLS